MYDAHFVVHHNIVGELRRLATKHVDDVKVAGAPEEKARFHECLEEDFGPGELDALFAEGHEAQAVRKAARHKLADLSMELNGYRAQADGIVQRALALQDED